MVTYCNNSLHVALAISFVCITFLLMCNSKVTHYKFPFLKRVHSIKISKNVGKEYQEVCEVKTFHPEPQLAELN